MEGEERGSRGSSTSGPIHQAGARGVRRTNEGSEEGKYHCICTRTCNCRIHGVVRGCGKAVKLLLLHG